MGEFSRLEQCEAYLVLSGNKSNRYSISADCLLYGFSQSIVRDARCAMIMNDFGARTDRPHMRVHASATARLLL
jgi:hypothetical protein